MKKLLFLLYAPLLFFCACKKKDQGTALKGVWARKADFPGVKRQAAVGFSIGGTGYIGTGYDGAIGLSDLYAYDPVSDSWTQRASLPVSPSLSRYGSVAFVIDGKAYLVGGNSATGFLKEVWEYDPANDMWTNKNPFPGPARGNGIGLSVGSFGYFGLGYSIAPLAQLTDWWKYDPSTDQWTQMLDFPGPNIQSGMGFGLASNGVVGISGDVQAPVDLWIYSPGPDQWDHAGTMPAGPSMTNSSGFTLNGICYLLNGSGSSSCWAYDVGQNTWQEQASLPELRMLSACFNIGNKAYAGTGDLNTEPSSLYFWEFDPQ